MREVAYRRLLARLFNARPEGWVVKGGAALLLRLDPNRTSNDIDIAYLDQAAGAGIEVVAGQRTLAALVEPAARGECQRMGGYGQTRRDPIADGGREIRNVEPSHQYCPSRAS